MSNTFKNYEIANIVNSMNLLSNIKLPIKVAWDIGYNQNRIESALNRFIKAERKIIAQYAVTDEYGNITYDNDQPIILPKLKQNFISDHSELLECECELELKKIKFSDLIKTSADVKELEIEPIILKTLSFMFDYDL